VTEETSKFSRVPSRAAGIRDLRGDDLRVLIAMGQHVDKAGNAHPSLSRIGALTGVSRKNVPRSIERLEKAGLIERRRVQAESGRWDRSRYRILFNGTKPETGADQDGLSNGLAKQIVERTEDHGAAIANEMLAIWEQECGDVLRVPAKLNRDRINACLARFKDSFNRDLEQWRGLCREIRASAFCCGGGKQGWKADFDWALKPRSILGVREGKYRDDTPRRRAVSNGPVSFDDYFVPPLGPGGS